MNVGNLFLHVLKLYQSKANAYIRFTGIVFCLIRPQSIFIIAISVKYTQQQKLLTHKNTEKCPSIRKRVNLIKILHQKFDKTWKFFIPVWPKGSNEQHLHRAENTVLNIILHKFLPTNFILFLKEALSFFPNEFGKFAKSC